MKKSDVDTFEKLKAQLDSIHQEMSTLAKKSPNDAVNVFKLRFVNATLENCNKLMGNIYKPFSDFDTFAPDELPSNSDVSFIVSQYIECVEKMRSDNIYSDVGKWYWNVDDFGDRIQTAEPKKLF